MTDLFCNQTLQSLYRYGYTLTHNEANAYDLLQDALERFLERPDPQPCEKPEFYVRRIMRNRFIDELRRNQRFPLESIEELDEPLADQDLYALESMVIEQHFLEQLWQQLNPLERELLHLWAVEELTAEEISEQLESPRGTILSRIHRLRKKIEQLNTDMTTGNNGGHAQ